jgi:hypothetical protein
LRFQGGNQPVDFFGNLSELFVRQWVGFHALPRHVIA